MKARKSSDLRNLTDADLLTALRGAQETLSTMKFRLALKELHDTAYIPVLRRDIAKINTIIHERKLVMKG